MADSSSYVMGQTAEERQRLVRQSAYLAPLTEVMLREAGLAAGMSVLDVGCGTGGVSLIAAKIVGDTGRVTGLDRDEPTLATARALAGDFGLRNLNYVSGALETAQFPATFDAVVGRLVLVHQTDPQTFVRQAAALVRPGGSVAFLEPDFSARAITWPSVEEIEKLWGWICEVFVRAKLPAHMGLGLYHVMQGAGLKDIRMRVETYAGGDRGFFVYDWLAGAAVSLAPKMELLGIARSADVLAIASPAQLTEAAIKLGAQVQGPPIAAAWARK